MPSKFDQDGARDMYLNTNATRKEIAEKLGLDPKTIYLWIKNGRWDEMKAAARQAPGIIQQQLFNHIEAINNAINQRDDCLPTYQEVEMLRKLISSTRQVQQMSLGTYVQAFQELTGFVATTSKDLEFTKQVTNIADQYIKGLLAKKKFYCKEKVRETLADLREMEKEDTPVELDPIPEPVVDDSVNSDHVSVSLSNTEPPLPDEEQNRETSGNGQEYEDDPESAADEDFDENEEEALPGKNSWANREIPTDPTSAEYFDYVQYVETTITREDYIKYSYLLEQPTRDVEKTIDYKGVKAHLMTLQYNLKQFELPEYRRRFQPRIEVKIAFLFRNGKM